MWSAINRDNSSYFWKLLRVAVLCCMFVCKPYSFFIPSTTQNTDVAFSFHNISVCHLQGITVEGHTIDIIISDMLAPKYYNQQQYYWFVLCSERKQSNDVVDMMNTHYSQALLY